MSQGVLPFKYEEEAKSSGMTALAGLPAFLDLAKVLGMASSASRHFSAGHQGWTAAQHVMALVLLQLAGGDCVDDLEVLQKDDGFCRVLQRVEADLLELPRAERRRLLLRWRKEKRRSVPSPSAARRFLNGFDIDDSKRGYGSAYVPAPTTALLSLQQVNRDVVERINGLNPQIVATLDEDATCIEVSKRTALRCYKGFKAFQPLNVYWAEHDVMLHSEFRDGNVPALYDNLRVLLESLEHLPSTVEKVRFRSDGAAYQWDLLMYLAKGLHPRFGVIEFTVSAEVSAELRAAVSQVPESEWRRLERTPDLKADERGRAKPVTRPIDPEPHEYADFFYEPNVVAFSKNNPTFRFVATRERLAEQPLPGITAEQLNLPFPVAKFADGWYKLHAIVSNRSEVSANDLILWHWARCGKSELAHDILKSDLAGGQMPSNDFGPNAAWWAITILAYNLQSAMKRTILGKEWASKRLKAIRFHLICLPGRVIEHARQLIVRLTAGHPSLGWLLRARERLLMQSG
jgi:hypothetical protein